MNQGCGVCGDQRCVSTHPAALTLARHTSPGPAGRGSWPQHSHGSRASGRHTKLSSSLKSNNFLSKKTKNCKWKMLRCKSPRQLRAGKRLEHLLRLKPAWQNGRRVTMTVTVWNAAASAPPASGEERASCDESQTFHGGPV